jgi:sugar lactone lactonase YvrE
MSEFVSVIIAILGIIIGIYGLSRPKRKKVTQFFIYLFAFLLIIGGSGMAGYYIGKNTPVLGNNPNVKYLDGAFEVKTFAGNGESGKEDSKGIAASFFTPEGMTIDNEGNIYVAEFDNNVIRKISKNGDVSTFAGSGLAGFQDGFGINAQFSAPSDLCYDKERNRLYVAEWGNHCIRIIDLKNKNVSVFAGNPGEPGIANGNGKNARFVLPSGIDCDHKGTVYVAEFGVNRIRKIDTLGNVSVVVGKINPGFNLGDFNQATFSGPYDVLVDENGDLLVCDYYNNSIKRIDLKSNSVKHWLGTGDLGYEDGSLDNAKLAGPSGIIFDENRDCYYVTDSENHAIRIVKSDKVYTLAGGSIRGFKDGSGRDAKFSIPMDLVIDEAENLIISDSGNERIRKIILPEKID